MNRTVILCRLSLALLIGLSACSRASSSSSETPSGSTQQPIPGESEAIASSLETPRETPLVTTPDEVSLPAGEPSLNLFSAIKDLEYTIPSVGTFQFEEGRYDNPDENLSAALIPSLVTYTDFDGNGLDDAVAIVEVSQGNEELLTNLAVVLNQGDRFANVDTVFLGDRIEVNTVTVDLGKIQVDVLTHGPNDAACCPTQSMTHRYELDGTTLIKVN